MSRSSETKTGSRHNIHQIVKKTNKKDGSLNLRIFFPRIFPLTSGLWVDCYSIQYAFPPSDVSIPATPFPSCHLPYVLPLMPFCSYDSILSITLLPSQSWVIRKLDSRSSYQTAYRKNLNNWTVCYEVQNSLLWKGGKNTAKTRPLSPLRERKKTKNS